MGEPRLGGAVVFPGHEGVVPERLPDPPSRDAGAAQGGQVGGEVGRGEPLEGPAVIRGEVHPHDEPVGVPAGGPVGHRHAAGEAVDELHVVVEALGHLRRHVLEPAVDRVEQDVADHRAQEGRDAGVGPQVHRAPDVIEAGHDIDGAGRGDAQVRVAAELLAVVVGLHALVVAVGAGDVVAQRVRSTRDRGAVLLGPSGGEHRAPAVRLLLDPVPGDDVAGRVLPVIGRHPAGGVVETHRALLGARGPPRRPAAALLGDDLDDPVGGLGAVDGGGGRPLDDLDAGDVFGVDVVEPRCGLRVLRAEGRGPGSRRSLVDRVVHPDPVDVDDRLRAERKRRAAADLDGRARADAPGVRRDDGAGGAGVQQRAEIRRRRLGQRVGSVDHRHRVAQRAPLLAPRRAGHHDLLQRVRGGLQPEVGGRLLVVGDGDRLPLRGVADPAGDDDLRARGDPRDAVAAVGAGGGAEPGPLDLEEDPGERQAGARVGDQAGHRPGEPHPALRPGRRPDRRIAAMRTRGEGFRARTGRRQDELRAGHEACGDPQPSRPLRTKRRCHASLLWMGDGLWIRAGGEHREARLRRPRCRGAARRRARRNTPARPAPRPRGPRRRASTA